MKTLILPLCVALVAGALALTTGVHAQDIKTKSPQQQKFADCSHKSKGLKGEEHKKFMHECLGNDTRASNAAAASNGMDMKHPKSPDTNPGMMTSQQRMKACSTEAKNQNLKGNDRKAFMRDCMKNNGR
ncbi:MAG: phosphate starvation-inducible protein PsiF [Gammaproteobacteria bacterium]|nr:phosphate starvation-inducible protein PsiF [Gammaproteobacteria bacterium]